MLKTAFQKRQFFLFCSFTGITSLLKGEVGIGNWIDFITITIVPMGIVPGAVSLYYISGADKILTESYNRHGTKPPKKYLILVKHVCGSLIDAIHVFGVIYKGIGKKHLI